jgi:hypothetical protein
LMTQRRPPAPPHRIAQQIQLPSGDREKYQEVREQ